VVVNAAVDTVEQSLVFCGREDDKLVALRQMVREGLRPPLLIFVQSIERAMQLFHALPVRRAGRGRAARGAYGRARPAAAADAASGGGAAPDDAEAADGGEAARPRNACGDERGAEVGPRRRKRLLRYLEHREDQ